MLLLPLDDRPCNLLFVVLLLTMAGSQPCLWQRYEGVAAKQRSGPPPIPTLARLAVPTSQGQPLIALNALAAGGLVGSRTLDPSQLPIPSLPADGLYLFVVPRLEPTARDPQSQEGYREVRTYLNSTDGQLRVLKVLQNRAAIDSLPAGAIRDWVTRTEGWIRWIEALRLPKERLLITFDDTRAGPLASWMRERYGWMSNHVLDGADEGGMLLAARAVREQRQAAVRVGVLFSNPGSAHLRGRYESLPVDDLIAGQARWLGITLVPASQMLPGEPLLLVHNWTTVEGDRHNADAPQPNPFPLPLSDLLDPFRTSPLYVADIAYANGGDPVLAGSLHERWQAGEANLRGYAGWNTAANSLGTTLALLTIDQSRVPSAKGDALREQFVTARFLDDVLYQSFLRQSMEQQLKQAKGDPWALTPFQVVKFEDSLTKRLRQEAFERGWLAAPSGWSLSLPWQRSFEATVTTSDMRRLIADTPKCP